MVEESLRNLALSREAGMITILVGGEPHQVANGHMPEIIWVARVVEHILKKQKRGCGH